MYPRTVDGGRFKKLKLVILDTGKEERELTVAQARFSKDRVILKFQEFSDINEVEPLRGGHLYVTRENALPLGEGEYYIADLIGMSVVSTEGEELGTLAEVMPTGANDVYIVARPDGEELLLPAIRDCVREVDQERELITVYLMPGLTG